MDDMYMATAVEPGVQVLVPRIVVPPGGWRAVTMAVEQPREIPAESQKAEIQMSWSPTHLEV